MKTWFGLIITLFIAGPSAVAGLPDGLYAAFDTSMGSFTCRLDYAEAPLTVANFVGLAEGTQNWISTNGAVKAEPFYDGLTFHRVIDGFMIQGGCPLGTGTGGPGYAFPDQISTNILHSKAGTLSMANSGPDSNGSQFFVTLTDTHHLDGAHAVFGEVVEGMDIVDAIGRTETDSGDRPLTNVVMNSVGIIRVGTDAHNFYFSEHDVPKVERCRVGFELVNEGIYVSVHHTNQYEYIFGTSTNLIDWASEVSSYETETLGEVWIPVSSNNTSCFFKETSVYHPNPFAVDEALRGKELTISGGNNYRFSLRSETEATFSINGAGFNVSQWLLFQSGPYLGVLRVIPEGANERYILLYRNKSARIYQYIGYWGYEGEYVYEVDATTP